jgi:hypothetical protein
MNVPDRLPADVSSPASFSFTGHVPSRGHRCTAHAVVIAPRYDSGTAKNVRRRPQRVDNVTVMALTPEQIEELTDNQFAFDGSAAGAIYVRHLPCDTGIYLGENPQDVDRALAHLPDCRNPNGPADTFRKQRPWPKGTPAQEEKKEEWLSRIKDHAATTDEDYAAAVTMLVDPLLPVGSDVARRLEAAGFVIINPDGSCAAVGAW